MHMYIYSFSIYVCYSYIYIYILSLFMDIVYTPDVQSIHGEPTSHQGFGACAEALVLVQKQNTRI